MDRIGLCVGLKDLYAPKTNWIMIFMTKVEAERLAQKRVEDLIAISLYQARTNRVKEYVRELYKSYEPYLKPIEEVRKVLAKEISGEKTLSQEVVELRRRGDTLES